LLAWEVSVSGGLPGGGFRDGAGDWVQGYSVRGPVDVITVEVQGQVETRDLAGLISGHRETVPPEAYLRDTVATRADAALAELSRFTVSGVSDALDRAHRLSAAVSEAIVYRPGVTQAQTTGAEAFSLGEGVCQDHAHALIAAARCAVLPARYVSGYMQSGDDAAAADPSEAAHAWAEIFVPGLGWVGFDPANRCCPDARYIRLGSGYDAQDAAPIRGIARGTGAESLDVTVAINAIQQ